MMAQHKCSWSPKGSLRRTLLICSHQPNVHVGKLHGSRGKLVQYARAGTLTETTLTETNPENGGLAGVKHT